jgi:nicotinamidase-related amidase
MATIREGHSPVLLVVDVQVGVLSDAWDASRVIRNVSRAVERAREQAVPVLWVQHADDEIVHGSAQWQWAPPLRPAPGEPCIGKRFNSSFEQTALDEELARLNATHIVLAGAATNWCIRSTAYGALERGYDLTLLKDAHTTSPIDLGDGTKVEAAAIVAELNTVMTWASYPGRSNGTALAAEIDFSRRADAVTPPIG